MLALTEIIQKTTNIIEAAGQQGEKQTSHWTEKCRCMDWARAAAVVLIIFKFLILFDLVKATYLAIVTKKSKLWRFAPEHDVNYNQAARLQTHNVVRIIASFLLAMRMRSEKPKTFFFLQILS